VVNNKADTEAARLPASHFESNEIGAQRDHFAYIHESLQIISWIG
jgi:hypothetical protein